MLENEKTKIFWIGLIIFGMSLIVLFTSVWYPFSYYGVYSSYYWYYAWRFVGPWIFGSLVFMVIGGYMMKSGAKKAKMIAVTSSIAATP